MGSGSTKVKKLNNSSTIADSQIRKNEYESKAVAKETYNNSALASNNNNKNAKVDTEKSMVTIRKHEQSVSVPGMIEESVTLTSVITSQDLIQGKRKLKSTEHANNNCNKTQLSSSTLNTTFSTNESERFSPIGKITSQNSYLKESFPIPKAAPRKWKTSRRSHDSSEIFRKYTMLTTQPNMSHEIDKTPASNKKTKTFGTKNTNNTSNSRENEAYQSQVTDLQARFNRYPLPAPRLSQSKRVKDKKIDNLSQNQISNKLPTSEVSGNSQPQPTIVCNPWTRKDAFWRKQEEEEEDISVNKFSLSPLPVYNAQENALMEEILREFG